ncbi:sensor histidine kinase [Brachybacterium hainanense]|uniref:histidine kinase n=1 Tax=Brachybacterium hainanense TaxID=1541174 RepID=A0ABV6RA36_9MICO
MTSLPMRSLARAERARSLAGPRRIMVDLLIGSAIVVGLWMTVAPPPSTGRGWQAGLAALIVVAVSVRSLAPVPGTLVAALATTAAWLLQATADPGIGVGLCLFAVAERRGARVFPWWLWLAAAGLSGLALVMGGSTAQEALQVAVLATVVLSAAWALGTRSRQVRAETAARARDEERLRLAREVHDVLSHSLGTIGVQAGIAAHVASLSREELRATLRDVETDARASLADLRHLLRSLREEDEEVPDSPLTASVRSMVRRLDRAGVGVEADIPGEVDALPLVQRQLIRRVLQEAITNVIRHSGASRCRIRVVTAAHELVVEVHDDGHGATAPLREGHGVTGMRERAALLGGRIDVGAAAGQGFLVRVVVPIGGGERR